MTPGCSSSERPTISGRSVFPILVRHSVLGPARREPVDRGVELARGHGAAPRNASDGLDLPSVDRRDVVPGLPVEVAAAGLRRLRILDRANGRARRVRVPPRSGEGFLPAEPEDHRPAGVPGRAWLRNFAHPRLRRAARRARGGALLAAPLARTLSP